MSNVSLLSRKILQKISVTFDSGFMQKTQDDYRYFLAIRDVWDRVIEDNILRLKNETDRGALVSWVIEAAGDIMRELGKEPTTATYLNEKLNRIKNGALVSDLKNSLEFSDNEQKYVQEVKKDIESLKTVIGSSGPEVSNEAKKLAQDWLKLLETIISADPVKWSSLSSLISDIDKGISEVHKKAVGESKDAFYDIPLESGDLLIELENTENSLSDIILGFLSKAQSFISEVENGLTEEKLNALLTPQEIEKIKESVVSIVETSQGISGLYKEMNDLVNRIKSDVNKILQIFE